MSLVNFLKALTNATSIEDLWDLHTRKMATFGFDRLLYGLTNFRTMNSLGDPEDSVILSNHPSAYTKTYIGDGLYRNAPVVDWLLENDGAVSWEIIGKMFMTGEITEAQKKVFAFNQQHKVTAGYSIGFKSISPRTKGAIALTARAGLSQEQVDQIWQKHGDEILVINNVAHLKVISLPYNSPQRSLTKRQREALLWVGDGKTMQDIAILMGLTSATVEKHLRLARQSLSVETTAQAVLKASFQNQMFVVDV